MIAALCGCEGAQTLTGSLVDTETGILVKNAVISQTSPRQDTVRTDSSGNFFLNSGFVYLMRGSPKFIFTIKKDGYKMKQVKTSRHEVTVRISKE
jgi:hypothetical protein